MIQIGFASDVKHALSAYKVVDNGLYAAGCVLSGFGTLPPADSICDDAIQTVLEFTVLQIQRSLEMLINRNCDNMDDAQKTLLSKLERLNETICLLQQQLGQGIYVAGTVLYAAGQHVLIIPFGDAKVYWLQEQTCALLQEEQPATYLRDALGGTNAFVPMHLYRQAFPVGAHLLCTTQNLAPEVQAEIVAEPTKRDAKMLAYTAYKAMDTKAGPAAVLVFSQEDMPQLMGGEDT